MKKAFLLIRILLKCGRAKKNEAKASSHTGSISEILMPVFLLALAVGMFFVGRALAVNRMRMGDTQSILSTVMVLAAALSFFIAIPQVVNQLYMSNDLDVLITLPFSDFTIVACKLITVAQMPLLICCGLILPCGLGYGLTLGGLGVLYWVGLILAAPLLTLGMVSLAGTLIIVLMRLFRFIRNRNVLSIISTLFMFALTIAYLALNTSDIDLAEADKLFNTFSQMLAPVTNAIPLIGLLLKAMTGSGILPLLGAIAVSFGAVAVVLLAARFCYFAAALGMQDASGSKERLSNETLKKNTRASGVKHALWKRELRTIFRTPAMITNGYLYSIVVPLFVGGTIGFKIVDSLKTSLTESGFAFNVENVRALIAGFDFGWQFWALFVTGFLFFMCSTSVAVSVLSCGCISREGKDYSVLKCLPVRMETVVMVKRDAAMLVNSISGFLIPFLLFAAAALLGLAPVWIIALALVEGLAWLVFLVDICCWSGVKKPNLNWEAEADACKNNIPGLIAFVAAFVLIIGVTFLCLQFDISIPSYAIVVALILPVSLAVIFDFQLKKEAEQLAERV